MKDTNYFLNMPNLLMAINQATSPEQVKELQKQYESKYNSAERVIALLPSIANAEELIKLIKSTNNILELDAIISSDQFKKYVNDIVLEKMLNNNKIFNISYVNKGILAGYAKNAMELYNITIKTGTWLYPITAASIFCANVSRLARDAATARELELLIMLPPITTAITFSDLSTTTNPFTSDFFQTAGIVSLDDCIGFNQMKEVLDVLINNPHIQEVSEQHIYKLKKIYNELEEGLQNRLKVSCNFVEDSNRECRDALIDIQKGLHKLDAIEFDQYVANHGGNKRTAGALILKM